MTSTVKIFTLIAIVGIASAITYVSFKADKQQELNLLAWSGYEEPQFLGEFEKKYNVKVNYKTFFGGDGMLTILNESPGVYDVVVADKDYLQKLLIPGKLQPLNENEFDFTNVLDSLKNHPAVWHENKRYGIVVEWGTSALVYNTDRLTKEEVSSYSILWDEKVKGKVAIWDWYLPNMGNISLANGNDQPFNITSDKFSNVKSRLKELRPQISAFHGSPSEIISALASEEAWIIPGAGEWLASILKQQGKPIDWAVPKEGGLIWLDALVIPKDAPHTELAKEYIKWMMTPEAQVLLSQKQAFNSNVANMEAYNILTDEQKDILKVHNAIEAQTLIDKLSDRTLPVQQSEKEWQEAWEKFKSM